MDLISVIVPVYNVEKYLDACVESIVNQTYGNLEIILVDDGSPDNCPAMCDAWAERDERIKVIHKENGGISEARNVGMDNSTGKYIGFVDSDDIIAHTMYEVLYNRLAENSADLAICKTVQFSQIPFKGFEKNKDVTVSVLRAEEGVELLLKEEISTTCPNTLAKRGLAINTPFDVGVINEDVMWTYRVIAKSSRFVFFDEELYAYYQRPGSTMNSEYSEKRFDALKALRMRADSIKNDFPALYPYAEQAYAGGCMYHYQTLCRLAETEEYLGFRKRLYKMFYDSDLKTVFSITDLKYKVWYTMFKCLPTLTCRIRNTLRIGL